VNADENSVEPAPEGTPQLSIVVPCHNEEENIGPLLERLLAVLHGLDRSFEVVLVDDGSRDRTLDRLREAHGAEPRVKYLALSRNFGHEAASTAGLRHAKGDAVVLMDADLQDPPEVIPTLVERWQEGFDLVFATRPEREGESWFKRKSSALFYRMMRRVVHFDFPADTGDFRLMARPVVEAFLRMPERNRFVRGMIAWTGFRTTSVEYRREARHGGTTKYDFPKLFVLAMDALTGFSAVPLRLVSLLGLFVTLLAAVGTLWIVFNRLFLGIDIPGYAFLVTGVLFLGGVQILMLGAIGEYVGRIYVETQRRPLYLVRERGGLAPVDPTETG
jgi:glycosyltransferase involved in cell wall biosynthesis